MAWVNPPSRSVGTLITPTIWNQDVVANLLYLKTPPLTRRGWESLTTSSTSYVPVHETQNIITASGGRVVFVATGTAYQTGVGALNVSLTLYVDGAKLPTANDDGLVRVGLPGTAYSHVPWTILYSTDTLTAAMHTFRIYAKVSAGTGIVHLQQLLMLEV